METMKKESKKQFFLNISSIIAACIGGLYVACMYTFALRYFYKYGQWPSPDLLPDSRQAGKDFYIHDMIMTILLFYQPILFIWFFIYFIYSCIKREAQNKVNLCILLITIILVLATTNGTVGSWYFD